MAFEPVDYDSRIASIQDAEKVAMEVLSRGHLSSEEEFLEAGVEVFLNNLGDSLQFIAEYIWYSTPRGDCLWMDHPAYGCSLAEIATSAMGGIDTRNWPEAYCLRLKRNLEKMAQGWVPVSQGWVPLQEGV